MSVATKTIGELAADLLAKRDEIDAAETKTKEMKGELEALENELSELMNDQGLQSMKSTDGRTIYKSRDLQVSVNAGNRAAVVSACQLLGLSDLIKTEVPTSSLKAHIREWLGDMGDQDQIPELLRPLVSVHESYAIRVRKGG